MSRSFLAAVVAARFVSILYDDMSLRDIEDTDGKSLYRRINRRETFRSVVE